MTEDLPKAKGSGPGYNAKKARTKYACQIWVDAFLRDTMDLSSDEIGAYHLILYAMWSREECDMFDDDRKLARLARCSQKLWKSRIRPALEPFFIIENGRWINTRLRKEAIRTEKFLGDQSTRRTGSAPSGNATGGNEAAQREEMISSKKSDKPLKDIEVKPTVDSTVEVSGRGPTQESKSLTKEEPPLAPQGGREKEIINFSRKQRTRSREQEAMAKAKEILRNMEAQRNADNQ